MIITFLGTGTSQGIPVIGCNCEVCLSDDVKDKRLRCSILIEWLGKQLVIDVSPDFRQQLLRAGASDIHAILLTHEHNDHIIGMDDVRPINFRYRRHLPVYASARVGEDLKRRFAYIFEKDPYPGAPRIELHPILSNQFIHIPSLPPIVPIEVLHGKLPVLGFRFDNFTYITDAKTISEKELQKIGGTEILVLNALHHRPHHAHLNLKEALDLVKIIQPTQAYLVHTSHYMGKHEAVSLTLPDNVYLAYDGLCLEL